MKRVFLSWSGKATGEPLAKAFKQFFDFTDDLQVFVSAEITPGEGWFGAIENALDGAKIGIGIIDGRAARSPWVHFEAGYLWRHLERFTPLVVTDDIALAGPLGQLQAVDGRIKENVVLLLSQLTTRLTQSAIRFWVEDKWPAWEAALARHVPRSGPLATQTAKMAAALEELPTSHLATNACMQAVVARSLKRARQSIVEARTHKIAASHYPHYLVDLQRRFQATLRLDAIAVLDRDEHFWPARVGTRIAQTSNPASRRIFVLDGPAKLERHFRTILAQSKCYEVYVCSRDTLSKIVPAAKDFSLFHLEAPTDAGEASLTAEYGHSDVGLPEIWFQSDPDRIDEHRRVFSLLLQHAKRVDPARPDLSSLRKDVFGVELVQYTHLPIEMSEYIRVDEYDEHEEKHAYYREMMDRMKEILTEDRGRRRRAEPCRILEFGAGTGIFTKRLAALSDVDLYAIEIDWQCYGVLVRNLLRRGGETTHVSADRRRHDFAMPSGSRVVALHQDSRVFNPEGQFSYVVSSFADHHIRQNDKAQYFRNVRDNLRDGALFIVGDEFLRPHDAQNVEEWKSAVHAYHGHIIELAHHDNNPILARLEEAAMESGLRRWGDFKVACEEYERMLDANAFRYTKELIGPTNAAVDVGGVYVYTVQVAS